MTKFITTKLDKGIVLKQRALVQNQTRVRLIIPAHTARVADMFGYDLKPVFVNGGSHVAVSSTTDNPEKFVKFILNDFTRNTELKAA